jgi:aspartate racemase
MTTQSERHATVTEAEPKTLGLVAGLGVGAAAFYYRALVNAHLKQGVTPHLLMVHADVRRVMGLAQARATRELAEYLAGLLQQLAAAGADIATVPAFAPQVCAEELEGLTPLPLISVLDAIVAETERREIRRAAIFGAHVTMETELFGRLQGVADVAPLAPAAFHQVGEIYRSIAETEQASPEEFKTLQSLARQLVDSGDADAIILAGTDLAFVFRPENTTFPHLDGARIHIEAIMRAITASPG